MYIYEFILILSFFCGGGILMSSFFKGKSEAEILKSCLQNIYTYTYCTCQKFGKLNFFFNDFEMHTMLTKATFI